MKLLGEYLLDIGAVTEASLALGLQKQKRSGGRLGSILCEEGALSDSSLTVALSLQSIERKKRLGFTGALRQISTLLRYVSVRPGRLYSCIVLGMLSGVVSFPILFYFFSCWAWDTFGMASNTIQLIYVSVGVMSLIALVLCFEAYLGLQSINISGHVLGAMGGLLHRKLILRQSADNVQDTDSLSSLFEQNLEQFVFHLELILIKGPKAAASLIVFLLIVTMANPSVAALILLLAPLAIVIPPIVSSKAQPHLTKEADYMADALDRIEPFFRFFRTSSGVLLRNSLDYVGTALSPHHLNQAKKWFFWNSSFNVSSFFNMLTICSILSYGGWKVIHGEMALALLFGLYLAVSFMLPRFNDLFETYFNIQSAGGYAHLINGHLCVSTFDDECSFENKGITGVEVAIPSYSVDGHLVLKDIHLRFLSGAAYLIVGESGAGKSTLAKIIAGLIPIEDGCVTISMVDNESVSQPLGYVAYIGQDHTFLESASLYGNLLGSLEPELALKNDADMAIRRFGVNLARKDLLDEASFNTAFSGGEKQRLHLVQGLLTPQSVCIFDEPTASLDSEAALLVKNALVSVPDDELRIIISHDLDWPIPANNIIRLSKVDTLCI